MKIDVERLKIANIQPGDTLLITLGNTVDKRNASAFHEALCRIYPDCKVILLAEGSKIQIVRGI